MATKQQWHEYFKLINNREPSLEEFQKAIEKGEIDEIAVEPVLAILPGRAPLPSKPAATEVQVQPKRQAVESSVQQPSTQPSVTVAPPKVAPAPPTVSAPTLATHFLPRPKNTAKVTSDHHVGFFEAYKLFWKNYVNFTGRSRRSEFWWVLLMNAIIRIILLVPAFVVLLANILSSLSSQSLDIYSYSQPYTPFSYGRASLLLAFFPVLLFNLAILVPELALIFRRLRDAGLGTMNGVAFVVFDAVLFILHFIPFVGIIFSLALATLGIYLIIVMARESDFYQNYPEPITDWFGKLFNHR